MLLASEAANQIIDTDDLAVSCFLFFFSKLFLREFSQEQVAVFILLSKEIPYEDYANLEMHGFE